MNKQELEEKYGHLKEQFFALYLGQKLIVTCAIGSLWLEKMSWGHFQAGIWNSYLCLEHLPDISDEDLDFIGPHLYGIKYNELKEEIENAGKKIQDHLKLTVTPPVVVDYLRSKGYALPFMGISVEEQILLGWIKIKKIKSIDLKG